MRYASPFTACLGGIVVVLGVLPLHRAAAQGRDRVALRDNARPLGPGFVVLTSEAAAPERLRRVVRLDAEKWTLAQVLDGVARQLDVDVMYDTLALRHPGRFTMKLRAVTGAGAALRALRGTGLQLEVNEDGSAIRIRPVKASSSVRADTTGMIVGAVHDAKTTQPLPDVEVLLEDLHWKTATDEQGRYQLEVSPGEHRLVARRLGYAKQVRKVVVRVGKVDTVDLSLEPVAAKLDELVTTATGQQRRRDIGNAITTIRADSVLRTAPVRSLSDLLEDRVPGMTVQHTSGAPGDPARLRLRGLASVRRSNDPVVVVDGIRVYAAQAEARSGNLTNLGGDIRDANGGVISAGGAFGQGVPAPSPLDAIDPNIIETIEVFKGPSAATLYGADAANGVIVITTKKGRPGPTRWNASVTHGRTTMPGRYPTGYYPWGHSLFNNRPKACYPGDSQCVLDSLVQFQALNEPSLTLFGRGHRTSASLAAAGGSQAVTYSVTGTYDDEIGVLRLPGLEVERFRTTFNREPLDWMRRPHQLTKWSVTSNVGARLGASADVTLSTTLARSEQQRSLLETQVAPMAGMYVDTINGIYYTPNNLGGGTPSASILGAYDTRTTASAINFTTGLNATWRPATWFNAMGRAGLNVIPRDDGLLLPAGLRAVTDSGAAVRGTGRSLVSTFDVQGSVRRPLRRGFTLEGSVGANLTSTTTSDLVTSASGLVPGTGSITGARTITATDAEVGTSVFGWYVEPRITGQRFALSTGLRLDGGSAYGARVKLLGLPKLNGSWVISEEPFFPFKSLFSSLRLRGAYGQAQVQPGPADRLRLYERSTGTSTIIGTLGNTQLRPERSTEVEAGIDADILGSRLSLELTGYRKMQVDALMPTPVPPSVNGGGSVLRNIGTIRNTGLEIVLRAIPVQSPVVTWSTTLTYTRNSNKLIELGRGVLEDPKQGLVAGYPVGARFARPILGFADQDSDGRLQLDEIQIGRDYMFVGRLYPAFQTSLYSDVALFGGAVSLSAGFSYDDGATQVDETARTNWVLSRELTDPTTPLDRQVAAVAYFNAGTDYGVMQEVSTLRFTSFSASYRAPARVARLLRAQELSVALQGANLGLHSTYRGKDPDVSAWGPGEAIVDRGQLPLPRTWQLALFLQY